MPEQPPYVWAFAACGLADVGRVGGKNANLGELTRAGFDVPPGFAVTAEAYRTFLDRGPGEEIRRLLADLDPEDVAALQAASEVIRRTIHASPLPGEVADAIAASYARLAEECDVEDLPVAVRSSATAEDLPGASFAGQHETYLSVRRVEEVLERTVRCWSSLFTAEAISYRIRMSFPHEQALISVGIQSMVVARVAGVMFTLNPANGDRSKVVIEASWGLGEAVVRGEVNPDQFVVDKVTLEILERVVQAKDVEYYADDDEFGHLACSSVPPERRELACLTDEEVVGLAELAKRVERFYARPQDIEWAIERRPSFACPLFLLQSRPETVWSGKPARRVVEPRATALDHVVSRLMGNA